MPHYLLSAIDPIHGRRVTEHVEAANGDEAVARLVTRGLTDVVLHSDEVFAALPGIDWESPAWTPADRLVMARGSRLRFTLLCVSKVLTNERWFFFAVFLLIVAVIVLRIVAWEYLGGGWYDAVFCAALLGLLIWLPGRVYFGRSRHLRTLKKLLVWGRWQEALAFLPAVPFTVPFYRAYFEAQALAGLGRVAEAVQALAPFAEGREAPEWLYWSLLAEVYAIANDREQMLAAKERALALSPQNPTLLLAVADNLLQHTGDVRRARELLAAARTHVISDSLRYMVSFVQALLALEDGQPALAREHLERGLVERAPHRNSPMSLLQDALLRTYLAIALARCGQRDAALGQFRRAEKILRARREHELLGKGERELGLAPGGGGMLQ